MNRTLRRNYSIQISDFGANSDNHEEVQEKEKSSENFETYFLELPELGENLSDEKKEESYRFTSPVESSKETKYFFKTEDDFISAKSGIYSHGKTDNHINISVLKEERSKVFCNDVSFSDDSFELDSSELDSAFSESIHELRGHKSKKVTTITDTINDIVDQFRTQNANEYDKCNDDLKSKTAYSKEAALFPQWTYDVKNRKFKPKKKRKSARRRGERRTQRSLRDIINWQTSLRRNPTVLYDVRPGISDGRTTFYKMAHSSSNENSEDSRGGMNGIVSKAQLTNAVQRKPNFERDHLHANYVEEILETSLEHQNGIVDNKSSQATEEGDRENGASYSSPPLSASASNGFSLTTTETLSSFFDSMSLRSVEEDEAFSFEWIRLKTFSDWPIKSIFSITLAKNGWVSLGKGDRARCYICHVVHEAWRIGDDPDQYHSPNCRFKIGQSNNIPISRGTSNQTPNMGQISRDYQQFSSLKNLLYPGNLSGVASSVGPLGPVQELSDQGLNMPQQDSFLPQGSNLQPHETNLRPNENYPLPQRNLTRPQEHYLLPQGDLSRLHQMREINTAPLTGNQKFTISKQILTGLPTSESVAAPTPRNTDSSRHAGNPRNTGTSNPQVPTDNLHSTAAAEAPSPHSKEAQLEALKRDPMGINFDRPKYPSYAILAERISSYTDWPAAMTQTPRDMALAGFFYAGYGDYTMCFFCGGGLRNWEAGDDPWVEHARWFQKCAFLLQKRGQEFVDLVQKRAAELDGDGNKEEMENSQITISTSGPRSTQANEENVMRSQAVTTIKRMGYSEGKIKDAIHTIKSRLPREEQKVSAQEILEVIFELNQSVSATHVGQSERVSMNFTNSINHSVSVSENTAHHIIQSDPAPEGNLNSTNEDASAMDNLNAELISLKQENSSLKDQILCKICMDEKVSIAFLPCGHLACCEDCAPAMRKCPICREFVGHYLDAILVLPS